MKFLLASLMILGMVFAPGFVGAQQRQEVQTVPSQLVPEVSGQGGVRCAQGAPCQFIDLIQLGANIIEFLIGAITLIAFVTIAIAGVVMLSSAGNESRYEQAKQILWYAVTGLILAFGSRIIVNAILVALGVQDQFIVT